MDRRAAKTFPGEARARSRRVAAIVLLAAACGGQNPLNLPTERMDAPVMSYEGTARLHPDAAVHLPSRVAVLPFVNETESPAASETVRKSFYNHFSTKNYEDVELAVVDRKLAGASLTDPAEVEQLEPQKLGELLHVDGLVYGHITHFDRIYAVVGALVNVGAKVRLVDARTGDVVWEGEDVSRAQEGEIPTSIIGAIGAAASAAMNMRQVVLLRASDELFRGMATTIPEPTVVGRIKPPAITSLLHDSAGRVRKAGDVIHVSLGGEPGMVARLSLRGFKDSLPMTEKEEGRYEASYTVVPGDTAANVVVVASLEDRGGNRSEFTDALGAFAIDTQPPSAPTDPAAEPASGAVRLRWRAVDAKDLAGYRVYQSATPLAGFAVVADTQLAEQTVEKLVDDVPVYFRVTAVDGAGNESEPSGVVRMVPRAQGATAVPAGPLAARTEWWASGSPYRVAGDLAVPKGATLTIEPGTVVEVDGGRITIDGTLVASGEADRGITFRAASASRGWKGVLLRSADGTLRNVAIEGALVGLTVSGASPTIESCHFDRDGTGLAIEGPFARPTVRGSTMVDDHQDGVVVRDSAQPVVESSRIARNGRHGVAIDAAAPRIEGNQIEGNGGDGIHSQHGSAVITGNTIVGNRGLDLSHDGARIEIGPNWWGSAEPAAVVTRIAGPVSFGAILAAPPGGGGAGAGATATTAVARAPRALSGAITGEVLLTAADSPYTVSGEVIASGGAHVTIGPGVTVRYAGRDAAIVVDGGSIVVAGTASAPVRFVSAQASPAPGDYRTAIELRGVASIVSRIEGAEVRHAEHGVVIAAGGPEISRSTLCDNLQSGVRVTGKAYPKITHTTITTNRGSAGVEIAGEGKPHLEANNIFGNAWSVQSSSSQYVFAQGNWWGGPPDAAQFIGNVDFTHPLDAPDPDAPRSEPVAQP